MTSQWKTKLINLSNMKNCPCPGYNWIRYTLLTRLNQQYSSKVHIICLYPLKDPSESHDFKQCSTDIQWQIGILTNEHWFDRPCLMSIQCLIVMLHMWSIICFINYNLSCIWSTFRHYQANDFSFSEIHRMQVAQQALNMYKAHAKS